MARENNSTQSPGWLFLAKADIPERWRERAVPVLLVPLLPEEAAQVLSGVPAEPQLSEEDEALLTLLTRGATVVDAAHELRLHVRTVERRLAALRQRLGVATTPDLVRLALEKGFR